MNIVPHHGAHPSHLTDAIRSSSRASTLNGVDSSSRPALSFAALAASSSTLVLATCFIFMFHQHHTSQMLVGKKYGSNVLGKFETKAACTPNTVDFSCVGDARISLQPTHDLGLTTSVATRVRLSWSTVPCQRRWDHPTYETIM